MIDRLGEMYRVALRVHPILPCMKLQQGWFWALLQMTVDKKPQYVRQRQFLTKMIKKYRGATVFHPTVSTFRGASLPLRNI